MTPPLRMTRQRLLAGAFLALLMALAVRVYAAANYQLPGTCDTALATYPSGDPRNGLHRVARDSNGYWYVVWENASQTDIVMAYSTISTPTATAHWQLVTLVDNTGTGMIGGAAVGSGSYPSICMGLDDVLHLVWKASDNTCYYTQCSDLSVSGGVSALATAANWTTPIVVSTNLTDYSFALDYKGSPHLAGRGAVTPTLEYTKYDTNTAVWLAQKTLSTQLATYTTVAVDSVALITDLDDNVYVAWRGADAAATSNVYLLSSSNADDVAPASSTWMNLGQTTTDPDLTVTSSLAAAPCLVVDSNGILMLVHKTGASMLQFNAGQLMGLPFQTGVKSYIYNVGGLSLASMPGGGTSTSSRGNAIWRVVSAQLVGDSLAQGAYRVTGTSDLPYAGMPLTYDINSFLSAARLPRNISNWIWFGTDTSNRKICSTDTAMAGGMLGWCPPSQSKSKPHPDLAWVWPNTNVDAGNLLATPIVAHNSNYAVYLTHQSSGRVWAIDSSTGAYARSYTLAIDSFENNQLVAATYSGNVHLYLPANGCKVLALVDTGSSIGLDSNWANNPKAVGDATGGKLHSLTLKTESGTRYLYMVASVATDNVGINKIQAATGDDAGGLFPVGTTGGGYVPNTVGGLATTLRIINDNLYVAGNISQIYRRGADGSGGIMSSVVACVVRHLMLWRNSNDLYVSPEGNYVYRLTSDLVANPTWCTSGSLRAKLKTTGAQMNNYWKGFLFVGAGNNLYKINVTDGAVQSNTGYAMIGGSGGNIVTAPYQWKSYVYFGTDQGQVFAVNASDPTVSRANWPVTLRDLSGQESNDSPVVSVALIDGVTNKLYVVTSTFKNRRIFCFRLE